jgi:hypothetical protein
MLLSIRRTMVVSQAEWRFLARLRIDHYAITSAVGVVRRMQRLMDVADKVD